MSMRDSGLDSSKAQSFGKREVRRRFSEWSEGPPEEPARINAGAASFKEADRLSL